MTATVLKNAPVLLGFRSMVLGLPYDQTVQVSQDAVCFRVSKAQAHELWEMFPLEHRMMTMLWSDTPDYKRTAPAASQGHQQEGDQEYDPEEPPLDKVSMCRYLAMMESFAIFAGVDNSVKKAVYYRMVERHYRPGDIVFRKGDLADHLYFVESGLFQVVDEDHGIVYGTLSPGSIFGEMAFISPHAMRNSSVRALELSSCQTLSSRVVKSLISDTVFAQMLVNMKKISDGRQILNDLLLSGEFMMACDREFLKELSGMVTAMEFGAGEIIFNIDEPADRLFFIVQGRVSIGADGVEMSEFDDGQFFGEACLSKEKQRTRAKAITQVFAYCAASEVLLPLLARYPAESERFQVTADARLSSEMQKLAVLRRHFPDLRSFAQALKHLPGENMVAQALFADALPGDSLKEKLAFFDCLPGQTVHDKSHFLQDMPGTTNRERAAFILTLPGDTVEAKCKFICIMPGNSNFEKVVYLEQIPGRTPATKEAFLMSLPGDTRAEQVAFLDSLEGDSVAEKAVHYQKSQAPGATERARERFWERVPGDDHSARVEFLEENMTESTLEAQARQWGGLVEDLPGTADVAVVAFRLLMDAVLPNATPDEQHAAVLNVPGTSIIDKIATLLSLNEHRIWLQLVQHTSMDIVMDKLLDRFHKPEIQRLSSVLDERGRPALDLATPASKAQIQSRLIFLGRFNLQADIHRSLTCTVKLAKDKLEKTKVTLKLMTDESEFKRELSFRQRGLDPHFVLPVLEAHVVENQLDTVYAIEEQPDQTLVFKPTSSVRSGEDDLRCLVMPYSDRTLQAAVEIEGFAGRDLNVVRLIAEQLARAVQHLHQNGIIHGDVKPRNAVRIDDFWKLIDLDGGAAIGHPVGLKQSTGYSTPPELARILFRPVTSRENLIFQITNLETELRMIQSNSGNNQQAITLIQRQIELRHLELKHVDELERNGMDTVERRYQRWLDRAEPTFDIWGYGVMLYLLCTGQELFPTDTNDNLVSAAERQRLALWTGIDDAQVRELAFAKADAGSVTSLAKEDLLNVIKSCLQPDPRLRAQSFGELLQMPFFNGRPMTSCKVLFVSSPGKGRNPATGLYDFDVMGLLQSLCRRYSGALIVAYDWAGSTSTDDRDTIFFDMIFENRFIGPSNEFEHRCGHTLFETWQLASSHDEKERWIDEVQSIILETRWWASYKGAVKAQIREVCQGGAKAILVRIDGGPITCVEARHLSAFIDEVRGDLRTLQVLDPAIELQEYESVFAFQKTLPRLLAEVYGRPVDGEHTAGHSWHGSQGPNQTPVEMLQVASTVLQVASALSSR